MTIVYKETKEIDVDKVRGLYLDVKWTAYTEDEGIIRSIIPNALHVISAWEGEELVGLVRTIGDGVYILYIQDLLVKEAYQGKGIGSELLQKMIHKNKHIPQKVLMTDNQESTVRFYEQNGFVKADGGSNGVAFVQYS